MEHGTVAFADREKCQCEPCRTAMHRYRKRRNFEEARGIQRMVDAEPVRRFLRPFLEAGYSYSDLGTSVGYTTAEARGTLTTLFEGKRGNPPAVKIHRTTAERLLSIRDPQRHFIPTVGIRRRHAALVRLGHQASTIVEAYGTSYRRMTDSLGRDVVRPATRDRFHEGYVLLRDVAATEPSRGFWQAAREHVPPPIAWEDDLIDEPDAEPEDWPCLLEGCGRSAFKLSLCEVHVRVAGGTLPLRNNPVKYRKTVLRLMRDEAA